MFPAKYAGTYRNTDVCIKGAGTRVSSPAHIYQDLKFFFDDLENRKFSNSLEKAAFTRAEFVRIHPFSDGNGRISRLIMNLSLLKDQLPLLCIRKESRQDYIEALDKYGTNRDLKPFYGFLFEIMKNTLHDFLAEYGSQI